jgi:hypothetical protein
MDDKRWFERSIIQKGPCATKVSKKSAQVSAGSVSKDSMNSTGAESSA